MKVLVIHSRGLDKASTRFRIVNHQAFLESQGISVEYVRRTRLDRAVLERLGEFDVVFNQKCLMSMVTARTIVNRSRRVVFDFDDAIFTRPGRPYGALTGARVRRRLHYWLEVADIVTPANEYLAGYARRHSSRIRVIRMSIDTAEWYPAAHPPDGVRIGWAGAPTNLKNLDLIQGALGQVMAERPGTRFAVFSGERPLLEVPYDYVPFQPGGEADFCRGLSIGVLPLREDPFTRGKSPIKAIQYLACGLPVVGNVVGATAEILNADNSLSVHNEGDWVRALIALIDNPALRHELGTAGRSHVLQNHDVETVRRQLLEVLIG